MAIYRLGEMIPVVDPSAFVHPDAVVIGDVVIEAEANVWPCAVVRGDYARVTIGAGTSVQDGSVLHVDEGEPLTVGAHCIIGHLVHLHCTSVGDGALVGSGATVSRGARIGAGALVAAGSVVLEGAVVEAGLVVAGIPARVISSKVPLDVEAMAATYRGNALRYRTDLERIG